MSAPRTVPSVRESQSELSEFHPTHGIRIRVGQPDESDQVDSLQACAAGSWFVVCQNCPQEPLYEVV